MGEFRGEMMLREVVLHGVPSAGDDMAAEAQGARRSRWRIWICRCRESWLGESGESCSGRFGPKAALDAMAHLWWTPKSMLRVLIENPY
jgi:hypothetical protein